MRFLVHFLFVIYLVIAETTDPHKPELLRSQVYIYRKKSVLPVRIYHCLYNDKRNIYYDITDHCIQAFKTGIFIDKWNDKNNLNRSSNVVRREEYNSKADLLTNEIFLRSGTVCRYDRGFCYDPKETINYAVVWEVSDVSFGKCPNDLEKAFFGFVDIWNFKTKSLQYLFYYDQNSDRAFYLGLDATSLCHNKAVWISGDEFIVSKWQLTKNSKPILSLNEEYIPLKSKKIVIEAIMRDYDLQEYPLDFDRKIGKEHVSDDNNLITILKRYQELILSSQKQLQKLLSYTSRKESIDAVNNSNDSLRITLAEYEAEIGEVNQKCGKAESVSQSTKEQLSNLQISLEKYKFEQYNKFKTVHENLHKEDMTLSDRLDSQVDDLIKLKHNLDDLDIEVRNQVIKFVAKKEVETMLFELESEFIRKVEGYRDNFSRILDGQEHTSVRNNVRINQLLDGLNESVKLVNSSIGNTMEKIGEYVPRDELHSILSKFQNEWQQFLDDSAENATLVSEEQEERLKISCHTDIQQNVFSMEKNIESAYEKAVQGIEKKVHSNFTELQEQVFNKISGLKGTLETALDNASHLRENFDERSGVMDEAIENLKVDVNDCKDDLEGMRKEEHEMIKTIENKLTELYDNAKDDDQEISSLKLKVEEVENRCNVIDASCTLLSVRFDRNLNELREANEADLKSKLEVIRTSTSTNWSLLKNDMDEFRIETRDKNRFIDQNIIGIETQIEEIEKKIMSHEFMLSNSSMTSDEAMEVIRSNITEIKNNIVVDEGRLFRMDIDLTRLNSNISEISRYIQEDERDRDSKGKTISIISGDIEKLEKNLRTQIDNSKGLEGSIDKIVDEMNNLRNIINISNTSVQNFEDIISSDINSTQLSLEKIKKDLDSLKLNVSEGSIMNKRNIYEIQQKIEDNNDELAKSDSAMMNLLSQIQKVLEDLERYKNAIEDTKISTMTYVNSRLASVSQEIGQIHTMILDERKATKQIENELNRKVDELTEQKFGDYDKNSVKLNQRLTGIEKDLTSRYADIDERIKKLEESAFLPPFPDDNVPIIE